MLDQSEMDDLSDGRLPVSVDDRRHHVVEMGVHVLVSRCGCAGQEEITHVLDRGVFRIARPIVNGLQGVGVRHQ